MTGGRAEASGENWREGGEKKDRNAKRIRKKKRKICTEGGERRTASSGRCGGSEDESTWPPLQQLPTSTISVIE